MQPSVATDRADPIRQLVAEAQLRAHYAQLPAMAIATTLGGLFTAWVLWGAVDARYIVVGMTVITLLSALRLLLHRHFFRLSPQRSAEARWRVIAVAGALVSGCVWGSAAPLLYPPQVPQYEVYLIVLLTMLPIVPVAALAVYLPAFYAYFFTCIAPFVVTLALQDARSEKMAALLLVMMMGAMLTFARRYSRSLAEAIRLRVQLSEKSSALEAAVRHKSQFIAAAGHDLRQPVHAMGMFLESLRQPGSRADDAEFIGHLDASLRNLRSMLTNILDISRLDADALGPRLQDVAVGELLRKLGDEYAPLARYKRLDLRCRFQPAVLRSDPVLLERMLRNLLSNALAYTERGGIALVCRSHGARARLQVWDTGRGIAPEHLGSAFEEFRQLGPREGSAANGLGLGLAIVQRMARLLGHAVRVRSVPGRGSVFTIELARSAAAPPAPAGQRVGRSAAAPAPGWVIVVDDDAAVGASAGALLRRWGHRTTVCASAEAALAALAGRTEVPQLLMVDFRLADGRSGLDAVAAIRARLGRPVPAILVTADTAPLRIREAYEAGHLLLHKPVDPELLRTCIAEACRPGPPQ